MRLIISDRGYFLFLAFLPFIMGALSLSVPGTVGFGVPKTALEGGEAPNEPGQILVLLNVGAIFMGTALTIRALIGERAIFLREQAVGLSTTAYMFAKVFVFAGFALLQSAVVVAINIIGKGWGPGAVDERRGDTQPIPRAVRRRRGMLRGRGHGRFGSLRAGQDERADHAAAGDRDHVAAGVPGRHDPGDRSHRARPDVVGDPGSVGLRVDGVDDRPAQAGAGSADAARLALEAHRSHVVDEPGLRKARSASAISSFVRFKIRLKGG